MTTYRHILLATDCTDGSGPACRQTAALAGNLGAEVSLLKVLEHLPQDVPNEPVPPEDVDKIEWFTRRALQELQQYAESSGIPAERANVVVTTDSPEEEIIRFIKSNGIDLVVVGAHERHGLALFQGRTADNLIHNAPCDVLVVHL
jgi:universal stress protein A